MPENAPYVHPRQPDYDSWPDGDLYERKGKLLDEIDERHSNQGITDWDYHYLMEKTTNFWQLLHFSANYRLELETEIFARDLEIDNLKQQLKDALEN